MFRALACILAALVLSSCAPSRSITPDAPPPRSVELQEARAIATMHFSPGVYFMDAADSSGYYYRAPEGVIQHTFGAFVRHEGGIFLARNTGRLRGYVIWGGGRTKIGDLSRAYHVFR